MNKQTQPNINEMGALAGDKGEMMAAAADLANKTIGAARARLCSAMERGEELIVDLQNTTRNRLKNADRAIREHPYRTIAIAAGLGALLGLLLARGRNPGE